MKKKKSKIEIYDAEYGSEVSPECEGMANDHDMPTPILRGEDAVRFMLEMYRQDNPTPEMLEERRKNREKTRRLMKKYKKNFNGLLW